MKILKLTSQHTNQIMELKDKLRPLDGKFRRTDIFIFFKDVENSNCNFCWGLMENNKIVGYLIAHLGTTFQKESDEEVIELDEVTVKPEYKKDLPLLFKSFLEDLKKKEIDKLAIELIEKRDAFETLKIYEYILSESGYETGAGQVFDHENKEFIWVRFHPEIRQDSWYL